MIKKIRIHTFLLLTLPTLVVIVSALVLMNWRILTRVQVDLTVSRAIFTLGGSEWTQVLNSVGFESITLEKFGRIEFSPEKLEVAAPGLSDQTMTSWTSLKVTPPVIITGEDERLQPAVTFETAELGQTIAGTLDQIWATPGARVTVAVKGAKKAVLTIAVERHESSAAISTHGPFKMIIDYCQVGGIAALPHQADSLTFRTQLPNHSRQVRITSYGRSMVFILTIDQRKATELFPKDGIPVTALDFSRQNIKGAPSTALIKDGELIYPDYPKIEKVSFRASDFVCLDRLDILIKEMLLDPKHKGIRFVLDGVAHVRTGSSEFPRDHRLTIFDTLWQNSRLMTIFSIIAWVFATTVGGYRLYKEIKT